MSIEAIVFPLNHFLSFRTGFNTVTLMMVLALFATAGHGQEPSQEVGQEPGQQPQSSDAVHADEARCEQLRARATAVHQERARMNDTEDFLALAVGMETLDVALDEIARDYARLSCGQSSNDSTADE